MRPAILRLLAFLVLAVALVSGPASAGPAGAPGQARAVAVQVRVPGALNSTAGVSGSGSYSYRDLVSVGGYSVSPKTAPGYASATASLNGVSLMGGLVTASTVRASAAADGQNNSPTGGFDGVVSGLVVAGQAAATGPNARFTLPDGLGWGVVNEQVVVSQPGAKAYRGYQVGLHLHLAIGWHDLPAGTEVLLGYVDAGAQAVPPPPAPKPSASPGKGGTPSTPATPTPAAPGSTPAAGARGGTAEPVAPEPAAPETNQPGGGLTGVTPFPIPVSGPAGDTQSPPPGGFSSAPPVAPLARATLLSDRYVFPVAGGASFSNDWGAPRATTGFHQGIDLFAALGTPLVAVADGELLSVGWNRLGGHRLWLKDGAGNLFYYAHLSAYAPIAKDGAKVRAGDIVGFMGNSGDAQGTPFHLHFEIHPSGRWAVPPYEYVSSWMGNAAPFASPQQPVLGPAAAPKQAAAPPAAVPSGPLMTLGWQDISMASGLDPGAVVEAAEAQIRIVEGDGALFGGVDAPDAESVLEAKVGATPAG